MQSKPQLSKTNFLILMRSTRWGLALTWSLCKPLLIAMVVSTILLSMVPVMLAFTLRAIVNEIMTLSQTGTTCLTLSLLFWLGVMFGITLIDIMGSFAHKYFLQRLDDELNLHLNTNILNHASRLDVAHFEDPNFQDILERVEQNIAGRFSLFIGKLLTVFNNTLQIISLTAILVIIEPLITIVLFVVAVPYLYVQWRLAKARYTEQFLYTTKLRWTRYYVDQLTNQDRVPETKLLRLAPVFIENFTRLMTELRDRNQRVHRRIFGGSVLFATLSSAAFFFTFVRVTMGVIEGSLTIGDVAIYGGATARLRSSLENAIVALTEALEQTLHISNLQHFLSVRSTLDTTQGITPPSLSGAIRLENVTFSYPGTQQPVLNNISLTIKPGETIAIVGKNGAGKTTLVKLLARLYEPSAGAIFFDDWDLKDLSLDYIHQKIAFVFQHFGRYEATALENIAFGSWEQLLNNAADVEKIAKKAGIQHMIEKMPEGYQTKLGRIFGTYTLSGGQWQKIAITRAFARDASLLILDEPTSNLDAAAEFGIFSNFRQLAQGRTTILISHRFSTVSMADRVFVLEDGRIIESGTHHDLLALGGHYAHLFYLHQQKLNGQVQFANN